MHLLPPFSSRTTLLRSFIQQASCRHSLRYLSSSPKPATQAASTPAKEKAKADAKSAPSDPRDAPLKMLDRPLGVAERPTTTMQTWADKRNALMDQDVRLAQREHLIREATKGYFTDLNATRRHGGKTWIAPPVNIREDVALYFPDIVGMSLDTKETKHTTNMCYGRISVIAMLSSKISETHVLGFAQHCNKLHKDNPLFQYIQINLQENILKSFLVSLFLKSIRSTIPKPLHPTYLVSSQNMEYQRAGLGMVNKHVGYVYLVDENLKVRWAGCADAKPEEAAALEGCVKVLLTRLEKNKKKSPGKG